MIKKLHLILPLLALAPMVHAEDDSWKYFKDVTILNLDAEARETVEQDRIKATLNIEYDAKTPEGVQSYINGKMTEALNAAKTVKNVKPQTGRYNVRKEMPYDEDLTLEQRQRKTVWKGSQTLILDSDNKADILKLVGGLQNMGFNIQSLNYYLSREKADSYKDKLVAEAIENMKASANKLAKQLDLPRVHFANISFNDIMPSPIRNFRAEGLMMAKSMSADAMPEPVAENGESDIVVNVNATVHLSK